MHPRLVPTAILTVILLGLAACDDGGGAPPAPVVQTGVVPPALFVSAMPTDAGPLLQVKTDAAAGDRVTLEARVGGRSDPFVENRAVFFVVDSVLKSCDQLHGDTCKKPWDYCCEPKDNLLANMATVQVVGADGQPLKLSLQSQHGLEPLKTVIIVGTVAQKDDAGTFVVNAETIHVKEG